MLVLSMVKDNTVLDWRGISHTLPIILRLFSRNSL